MTNPGPATASPPSSPGPAPDAPAEPAAAPPAFTPPRPGFFERFTERQMTLGVLLFGVLLYIPFAGSYGLWDPWETHYGEVARQMLVRGDYVSLWWPGSPIDSEYFWSKPVLTFWIMSLSMRLAGIGSASGPPGEMAVGSAAEWALRVPFCLMALMALYGVYLVTARFVSRRAGVLATVVLATSPLFSLVARQGMTDMPFVGPMTLALALGALALFEDDDRELPRRQWKRLSWPHHPLFYATLALIIVVAVPQLVIDIAQVKWTLVLRRKSLVLPGIVLFLPYVVGLVAFIYWTARTRFRAPFYLYLAAILCGLAMLAKGLAGLGLPVIVFLAYLMFTWNWKRLARAQLLYGVMVALLGCAVVAVPWHHAMLMRHGIPFWNELYGDNHWRRLVQGRHGDRGTFEYFLRQTGYAILPWIALAPSALAWVIMRPFRNRVVPDAAAAPPGKTDRRRDIFWLGAIWFVAAYAVVSLSMTKFHHYILPGLPGLAIAIACFIDDVVENHRSRVATLAVLVGLPLLALVLHDLVSAQKSAQNFLWLFSYDYVNAPQGRTWPSELNYVPVLLAFGGLFAAGAIVLALPRVRRFAPALLGLTAITFTYFLLDVLMKQTSERWSQKNLIADYYRKRRGPEERLIAWQMYWRGETFYTKNEIYEGASEARTVFLGDRNAENLKDFLGKNRGKRVYFVVEKVRWNTLKGLLPPETQASLRMVNDTNNKFCLAAAEM